MKPLIRTTVCLVLLAFATTHNAFSNDGSGTFPKASFSTNFLASLPSFTASFHLPAVNSSKVCVCQILNLKSNNYRHDDVAVLAEKTNNGDISADMETAKEVLEKEKKHMKDFFYDKMKVTSKVAVATDCHTLYEQLKFSNGSLKLYDILDADIRK